MSEVRDKTAFSPEVVDRLIDLLEVTNFHNAARSVVRLMWYRRIDDAPDKHEVAEHERERNGEHAEQLGTLADYLNERHRLGLDEYKLKWYARVHDWPETVGHDTPIGPRHLIAVLGPERSTKEERERDARERIASSHFGCLWPTAIEWMERYEAQADAESRFINALDKLVAELNIYLDKGRCDRAVGMPLDEKWRLKAKRVEKVPFIAELFELLYAVWPEEWQCQPPAQLELFENPYSARPREWSPREVPSMPHNEALVGAKIKEAAE